MLVTPIYQIWYFKWINGINTCLSYDFNIYPYPYFIRNTIYRVYRKYYPMVMELFKRVKWNKWCEIYQYNGVSILHIILVRFLLLCYIHNGRYILHTGTSFSGTLQRHSLYEVRLAAFVELGLFAYTRMRRDTPIRSCVCFGDPYRAQRHSALFMTPTNTAQCMEGLLTSDMICKRKERISG